MGKNADTKESATEKINVTNAVKMFNKEDLMMSLIICSQFALLYIPLAKC